MKSRRIVHERRRNRPPASPSMEKSGLPGQRRAESLSSFEGIPQTRSKADVYHSWEKPRHQAGTSRPIQSPQI